MARLKPPTVAVALSGRFLVGTAAVIALLGSASAAATASSAPQSSSARYAAEASQYQNSAIARMMDRVPGGSRVSAGEVEWGHGAMILVVPMSPDATASCPGAHVCVWTAHNYTGSELQINDNPAVQNWIRVGLALDAEYSVINQTGWRYWMEQYQNHGNEYCINPGQDVPDVPTANDHDYWGLVTLNANAC